MTVRTCECYSCRSFSQLGRLDKAQALLEAWWEHLNSMGEGASERAIDQVRMHIELASQAESGRTGSRVSRPGLSDGPDDDRVWLGRANLALRTGDYAEATRWLDACLKRRPRDIPVWSARLRLGIATNRIDLVQQAPLALACRAARPGTDSSAWRLALLAPGDDTNPNVGNWSACSPSIRPI